MAEPAPLQLAYLAKYMAPELISFMASSRGRGRVLFASDHPFLPLPRAIAAARQLPIDDQSMAAYLGGAAAGILKLEPPAGRAGAPVPARRPSLEQAGRQPVQDVGLRDEAVAELEPGHDLSQDERAAHDHVLAPGDHPGATAPRRGRLGRQDVAPPVDGGPSQDEWWIAHRS